MAKKPISTEKDLYFVAVKVFLRKGGQLLILKDNFGDWDLPGGRLKPTEFDAPLPKVVARKLKEELGPVRYTLGAPVVFLRHERIEAVPGNPKVRIFAVGYEAKYVSGNPRLSKRHPVAQWVALKDFNPKKYFKGGWCRGVEEYLALQG